MLFEFVQHPHPYNSDVDSKNYYNARYKIRN